jgi:hypothetical protein
MAEISPASTRLKETLPWCSHVEISPELPLIMVKLRGSRGPNRGDRITRRFPAANIYLFDATGSAISVKLLN